MCTKTFPLYFTQSNIENRRQRVAKKWNEILKDDEAVLIYSGSPIQKPGGLDHTYYFLPHPSYYWLTARRREDEVICYNKNSGWIEFQKTFTKEQGVWEREKDDVLIAETGKNIHELQDYLNTQNFSAVYKLGQTSEYHAKGKLFELNTILDQTRRIKDEEEVNLIKHIAKIAASGYRRIEEIIRPGISEREIQIEYEAEIFRQGSHIVPYETIIGSGENAAILHALPTEKIVRENEVVLVDAGADVYDYCVDITRTYGSSKKMDSRRRSLYQLVLQVEKECINISRPKTFWREVHNKAAILFTQGLRDLGILKGDVNDLIEKEIIYLFFPHGLGHLTGLRVRDTGHEENLDPKKYFGARLRIDIQLEPGHLVTVEPGLYFIKALLEDEGNIRKYKEDINWQELDKWKNMGGIRIEDDILITGSGNENLTSCVPKADEL